VSGGGQHPMVTATDELEQLVAAQPPVTDCLGPADGAEFGMGIWNIGGRTMYRPARVRLLRAVSAGLIVVLVAAACSDSATGDTATPASSSTSLLPSTIAPSTSISPAASSPTTAPTTTAPSPPLPTCPDGDPLAAADIDGDGIDEQLMITERPGGQTLWACGPDGGRSLELPYAVWYLAVADVEPDGIDEVFLGAASFDDAPGVASAGLHWIEPMSDRLVAFTKDFAGADVGPTDGTACVDVDGDGVRELVSVGVDGEASTVDTVVWRRQVSSAIPHTGDTAAATGEFAVGRDDAAIAFLHTFSCGDDLVDLIRVRPPAAICTASNRLPGEPVSVDLDGDGLEDLVILREAKGDEALSGFQYGIPAVAVCLGSGITDEVLVGGMGGVFRVGTGPGGRPMMWSGDTTMAAAFSLPMLVDNGRLVFVRDEAAEPLTFRDGRHGYDLAGNLVWGRSGCGDVNADGRDEFVQVEAMRVGNRLDWTRRTWTLRGTVAVPGPSDSGSVPMPADYATQGIGGSLDSLAPQSC